MFFTFCIMLAARGIYHKLQAGPGWARGREGGGEEKLVELVDKVGPADPRPAPSLPPAPSTLLVQRWSSALALVTLSIGVGSVGIDRAGRGGAKRVDRRARWAPTNNQFECHTMRHDAVPKQAVSGQLQGKPPSSANKFTAARPHAKTYSLANPLRVVQRSTAIIR